VQRLQGTLTATGVHRLLLMVEGGGTERRTVENIRRLGSEVLPALCGS
jgi:hypothetical protein